MGACLNDHLKRFGGLAVGHEEEQKRYFAEKRLYALQIETTDACHQGCIYCYAGSTPRESQGLTSDEIRGLLKDAASLEIRAIDWLGGDPLVRDDWYELMLYARSLGLVNNVWTSGLPLKNKEVAAKVHEVSEGGFVSVHVDSITPEVFAKLHRGGHPHNIDTVIEGVRNLLALGKSADRMINCITYTSAQGPEDAIKTMRWWFDELGLRTCLTMFNPAGMGAEWRAFEPGLDEVQQVYTERDRINFGDDNISIAAMDTDKYYCGTMATVTFTGEVTPCSVIRDGVGNIRVTPFLDIITQHLDTLVHGKLHDVGNLPDPCNACVNNAHCWGCRASAYHYNGDADGLDPKCWLIRSAGEGAPFHQST
ncbi:MAG: radical SAM protein [Chlorobiaceae bacterium]|jgi:MoaA/NifB/PqqE/SkfB family radical SAM enzyme|nr:radical SAM protein [Chlorobiaceae bacterium]